MFEVDEISVRYGTRDVIRAITFDLRLGEIVAVLGPNGAGKTTLIRALNRTIPIATGSIRLDGRRLAEYSRREIAKNISVVAQENETKFPVTVLEYVLAGRFANGLVFGWESESDVEAAMAALDKCGLGEFSGRIMNELSGGERQRVVFARALATDARVLLLDEPTSNLDLAYQAMMFGLVRERCKAGEGAAVVTTHDLNLAAEFADKVLLLRKGEVFAFGALAEILTAANLKEVFDVEVLLDTNPASGNVRVTTLYGGGAR